MYAVIRTGGKQYKVAEDEIIYVEKLDGEKGDCVQFTDVLMVAGAKSPKIGTPLVKGASVAGEVVEQTRGEKIIVFKKKRRKGYKRKKGHRQLLTCVKILSIGLDGKAPAKKTEAKKKTATKKKTAPKKIAEKKADSSKGDDVSLISGIGPVIVKKLADLGYMTIKQIAELTPEQIADIEEKLNFKGRIGREEWVKQAKELIAGKS